MRIKITVDDWYLRNWYGVSKGSTRQVVEIVYTNKKKKEHIYGYKINAFHLADTNIKGQYSPILIRKHECIELPDIKKSIRPKIDALASRVASGSKAKV